MPGPHKVYDVQLQSGPRQYLTVRCGNPDCPVAGGAILMRILPDGLEQISAILICWKCSANNIVSLDATGPEELLEHIQVELSLVDHGPPAPCFFCGNGVDDEETYILEGHASALTVCRRCAKQMSPAK